MRTTEHVFNTNRNIYLIIFSISIATSWALRDIIYGKKSNYVQFFKSVKIRNVNVNLVILRHAVCLGATLNRLMLGTSPQHLHVILRFTRC